MESSIKKSKKRILFLIQLPPPIHGVSLMNQKLIESRLVNDTFEIETVKFHFAQDLSSIAQISFIKIFKVFIYAFEILRKSLGKKIDLAYFTIAPTGIAFYRDLLYVLILKTLRLKILFHLHGKGISQKIRSSRTHRVLYRWAFKDSKVICLSKRLATDIQDIYSTKPFVVANGIDLQSTATIEIENLTGKPQILFISNYFTSKGILDLIEALRIVKDQGLAFTSKLVGAPGDLSTENLRNRVQQAGLKNQVRICGPLYGADKIQALKESDIFVHPSHNDAFPLVILEAMQFGLPIITTDEGGIPDMICPGKTGVLVTKGDVKSLANEIAALLQDPQRSRAMGLYGRSRFLQQYKLSDFEKNLNAVLSTVLYTGSELQRSALSVGHPSLDPNIA
jgi:glycosyltransferase involved in cell wall biosynthesis